MTTRWSLLAVAFGMVAASLAHHSFAAGFDQNKPRKLSGGWMNAQAHFCVNLKDDAGNVTNWDFERASASVLLMQGWRVMQGWRAPVLEGGRSSHREGLMAKDGAKMANARKVTFRMAEKFSWDARPLASHNRTIII